MIQSVLDNIKNAINIKTKVKHSKTLRELKDKIHVLPSPQKLTAFWGLLLSLDVEQMELKVGC